MMRLLSVLALFTSVTGTAQVTPEFIYTNGYVSPLNLDGTLAKYYSADVGAGEIKVFNANHSLWKTVSTPGIAAGSSSVEGAHVSSTLFNTDALLDVVYRTGDDTVKLVNESGVTLFRADSAKRFVVDVLAGGAPMILTSVHRTGPGGILPVTKPHYAPNPVPVGTFYGTPSRRVKLSDNVERIITYPGLGGGSIQLYNFNGTVFHSFFFFNGPAGPTEFLSDNIVNSDTKSEAIFRFGTTPYSRLINSDGTTLLSTAGDNFYGQVLYSHMNGQPDKIIVQDDTVNRVYSVPGLQLDYTYPFGMGQMGSSGGIFRVALETSGIKYYRVNPTTNTLDLYNANHTFWKSIPLIVSSGTSTNSPRIIDISETTVNSDNQVEVIYEHYIAGRYRGHVSNDLGGTLLIYDVKQSSPPTLHRFPDGTAKLIVYQDTASQTYTRIYGFPMTIPAGVDDALTRKADITFAIAPNPAGDAFHLTFTSAALRTVTLHNIQGRRVLTAKSRDASFTCDVAALPRGMYQITVSEGDRMYFTNIVLH